MCADQRTAKKAPAPHRNRCEASKGGLLERDKILAADAVDAVATVAAGRIRAAVACRFVAGAAVHRGGVDVLQADGELNVDASAFHAVFTRRAADAVDALESTIVVALAERTRARIDATYAFIAVASLAAVSRRATVEADRVEADASFAAIAIFHALPRRDGDVSADAFFAHLAGGAAALGALRRALTVKANATFAAFGVELTDLVVRAAFTGDTGEPVGTNTRLRTAAARLAAAHRIFDAHAITAHERSVATICVSNACSWGGDRLWLRRVHAAPRTACRPLFAVLVNRTLSDAADVSAEKAIGAFEITTAARALGRIDFAAADAVARVASVCVAIVRIGAAGAHQRKSEESRDENAGRNGGHKILEICRDGEGGTMNSLSRNVPAWTSSRDSAPLLLEVTGSTGQLDNVFQRISNIWVELSGFQKINGPQDQMRRDARAPPGMCRSFDAMRRAVTACEHGYTRRPYGLLSRSGVAANPHARSCP